MEAIVVKTRREELVEALEAFPGLTGVEYAGILGCKRQRVHEMLSEMKRAGSVVVVGGTPNSRNDPSRYALPNHGLQLGPRAEGTPEPKAIEEVKLEVVAPGGPPDIPRKGTIMRMVLDAVIMNPGHKSEWYANKLWEAGGPASTKVRHQVSSAMYGLDKRGLIQRIPADAHKRRNYRAEPTTAIAEYAFRVLRDRGVERPLRIVPPSKPYLAPEPPGVPDLIETDGLQPEPGGYADAVTKLRAERAELVARLAKIDTALEVLEEL